MKADKYYVAKCTECKELLLLKVEYIKMGDKCCLDEKNVKIIKTFNDENEARNYMEG